MPDKKAFLSFGFRLFLYVLAGILLSDILFYYTTDHSLGETYYDAVVVLEVAKHTSMLFFFSVSAIIFLVSILLVFITSLVMSHKISGPIYRFTMCAIRVADGDLTTKAVLRGGDQLMVQADEFNSAVSAMHVKVARCAALAEELKNKSYVLEGASRTGDCSKDEADKVVLEMKAAAREFSETVSQFKTAQAGKGLSNQ